MKLLAAISFTAILLFNLVGYQLLTRYWQGQQNTLLEARLDEQQYSEAELVTVKIPVRLPYYSNSETFERVRGEITLNGVLYKYVERRVFNDSIELRCIPNFFKMQLQQARNDFFKLTNDLQTGAQNKKHAPLQIKTVGFDYCQPLTTYHFSLPRPAKQKHLLRGSCFFPAAFALRAEHPPEIV